MTSTASATNFYNRRAEEIYDTNFDYTIVETSEPQREAKKNLTSAIKRKLATAVFAVAASIITIPASTISVNAAATNAFVRNASGVQNPRAPNVIAMTSKMLERAALANNLFQHIPHPDDDDVEPDYGI